MKKSEFTVSMPITAYTEYEDYKNKYLALATALAGLFSPHEQGNYKCVSYDSEKAFELAKQFLPYSMQGADIERI